MRTVQALTIAAAIAGSALLSAPSIAETVCDKTCVGPLCTKNCVHERDVTVGRRDRDVVIEERRHTRPDVEIRRERRPGVEIDVR